MSQSVFQEVQETVDRATDEVKKYLRDLDPYLTQKVPGTKGLDDTAFIQWVAKTRKEHKPEALIRPDGTVVFESPAIIAWQYINETKSEYARYVKMFGEPPVVEIPNTQEAS